MSKKITTGDLKMGQLLGDEHPTPEEVSLTVGTKRKIPRPSDIFDWKLMVLSVSFVFGLCGTTIMWFTVIYQEQIFKTLTLGNGSKLHMAWKNPPLEPLLCVHIFNYTNAQEFFSKSNKNQPVVKLQVQDVGPYCFREKIERSHIKFMDNGARLSYREERIHTFDESASNGSLSDIVYVPNVLILSVYKVVAELSPILQFAGTAGLSGTDIVINRTVYEYLFGYEDEVFNTISDVHNLFAQNETPRLNRFGILQKRVGLSNDTIVINTGDDNLDEMGQVVEINNITEFTAWGSKECNKVTGSDGLFFRRSLVQSLQPVALFHKDSCRTLPLEFGSTLHLPGDIIAYRYKLKSDIFDPMKINNQCFFNNTNMRRYGVLEISSCMAVSGAPMVLSRPHFFNSNANLAVDGNPIIEGLQPDPTKHEFSIDIFPPIGLTVRTLMRMQLNIAVKNPRVDHLSPLFNDMVLPISWIEMNSGETVPEKMYSLLYHLSHTMKWAEVVLKWAFLLFTFLIAFILFKISLPKSLKK